MNDSPFPIVDNALEKRFGKFSALVDSLRARQRLATELDEEIRSWYSDRYKNGYFVLTSTLEVIKFETKKDLDSFLIQQLENKVYDIMLAHPYKSWIEYSVYERYNKLLTVIAQNEEAQNAN